MKARPPEPPAPADRPLRLTLELSRDRDPVEGTVCESNTSRHFVGWMELVTVLEAIAAEPIDKERA